MLTSKSLDDMSFEQIAEKAKESIAKYCSEWTDRNSHDPGIMLIELFAWLTEMQRYYIDNCVDVSMISNLLQMPLRKAKQSVASAYVTEALNCDSNIIIPSKTTAMAGRICFETDRVYCVNVNKAIFVKIDSNIYHIGKTVPFAPFGNLPQKGNSFSVFFDSPFSDNSENRIIFSLESIKKRNPYLADYPIKFADLKWESYGLSGWSDLNIVNDETHELIYSGMLTFKLSSPMTIYENGYYCIRCTLVENSYDAAPILSDISTEVLGFIQQETLAEDIVLQIASNVEESTYLSVFGEHMFFKVLGDEYTQIAEDSINTTEYMSDEQHSEIHIVSHKIDFINYRTIGVANGFPNQSFRVEVFGKIIVYDSFEILISEDYTFKKAYIWRKVNNFHKSGPNDRHYILDEYTGIITFGDGVCGFMPGGVIMIASMALTQAGNGNIQAGQLSEINYGEYRIKLSQREHACGGTQREDIESALKRFNKKLTRAVTEDDYETIIKKTPGLMIEAVRAFADNSLVYVAVKPYLTHKISALYKKQILAYLEQFRLIGTMINIISPVYIRLSISAQVRVKPFRKDIKPFLKQSIDSYFKEKYSGFGSVIKYNNLFAFINSLDVTDRLLSLAIKAEGANIRTMPTGDMILPPNAIASAEEIIISEG